MIYPLLGEPVPEESGRRMAERRPLALIGNALPQSPLLEPNGLDFEFPSGTRDRIDP